MRDAGSAVAQSLSEALYVNLYCHRCRRVQETSACKQSCLLSRHSKRKGDSLCIASTSRPEVFCLSAAVFSFLGILGNLFCRQHSASP